MSMFIKGLKYVIPCQSHFLNQSNFVYSNGSETVNISYTAAANIKLRN